MSFPAYPDYKESGVEWLGLIPKEWTVIAPKRVIRHESGGTEIKGNCALEPSDGLYPAFSASGQDVWLPSYRYDLSGLVLSAVGARCGKTFKADGRWGVVANTQCLIPSNDASRDYFWYLTNIENWWEIGGSAQPFVLTSATLERLFALPPLAEQTQIARFLDHETARIDALIEEQQRLIELLKEKRQAVISHAVTKGLDPTVPMKDSGVEWLGEVPAHWEVSRLKFVTTIVDCKNRTPEYVDGGEYLVVRTSNVKNQILSLEGALYTDEANFKIWTQRGVPPVGSILFTREAPAGEVCLVPDAVPLCLGQRMMNVIPHDVGCTAFLFDFLTSDCLSRYIESVAHGSTVSHLRVEQIYDIPVAIPPLHEQVQIDECWRRPKIDPPCRLKIDPVQIADFSLSNCG